jgi:hypothetical protein
MTVAEERKKRQEKFRKRTGSLFDKVKKLALDTSFQLRSTRASAALNGER